MTLLTQILLVRRDAPHLRSELNQECKLTIWKLTQALNTILRKSLNTRLPLTTLSVLNVEPMLSRIRPLHLLQLVPVDMPPNIQYSHQLREISQDGPCLRLVVLIKHLRNMITIRLTTQSQALELRATLRRLAPKFATSDHLVAKTVTDWVLLRIRCKAEPV